MNLYRDILEFPILNTEYRLFEVLKKYECKQVLRPKISKIVTFEVNIT